MTRPPRLRYSMASLAIAAFASVCCLLTPAATSFTGPAEKPLPAGAGPRVTTVLLIRHAEKEASPPEDPPLSETGRARAQSLVRVAGKSGISAIYTTQFLRTQQTAQPLAAHLGLTPVILPIKMDDTSNPKKMSARSLKEITDKVSEHAGQTILIVGHSNTVPDIIKALGGDNAPSIGDRDFDDLFIVTIAGQGGAKLISLKYGSPG